MDITSNELYKLYSSGNTLILDIRTKEDYRKKHIPNSYNIPYNMLLNGCISYLNKDYTYYIICDNGSLSRKASFILKSKGYKSINVLDGFNNWAGPIITQS